MNVPIYPFIGDFRFDFLLKIREKGELPNLQVFLRDIIYESDRYNGTQHTSMKIVIKLQLHQKSICEHITINFI